MDIQRIKTKKAASVSKEVKASEIWSDDKMSTLRKYILAKSKKQSPERKLKNELLAIKFQMQDYLEKDKVDREMRIHDFVKLYLKVLNISQKDLATAFEMKDSNLYKYLTGERKLNSDIVLKLSHFFKTEPELWFHIEVKNELRELRKQENIKSYEKYDYKNLLVYQVNEK
jgi:plasmid maintenance system antidote protein VapI